MALPFRVALLLLGLAVLHLEVSARAAAPQAAGWAISEKEALPAPAALKQTSVAATSKPKVVKVASDEEGSDEDDDEDEDDEDEDGTHYDEHDADEDEDEDEEDEEDEDDDDDGAYQEDMPVPRHSEADRQLQLFKSELECPDPDYDRMKDKFLRHFEKWMHGNFNFEEPGANILLSLLFIHLDKNMDSHLNTLELNKVMAEVHSAGWPENCLPSLLIVHGDSDGDELLDNDEFIRCFNNSKSVTIEGVSVVTLDKDLQWVQRRAKMGDNVELACDVSGTPPPPIVWERNGVYLGTSKPAGAATSTPPPHYPAVDLGFKVFEDGALFIPNAEMYHAGNYSCYAPRNHALVQYHHLDIFTGPIVTVEPRVQTRLPGEDAVIFCHVTGEPFPQVQWQKGEEPLRATDPRKYVTIGNGTELRVRHVEFADTGVYFCKAQSSVGTTKDMSTIIVVQQDTQAVKLQTREHRFFLFDDRGIAIYEPRSCRLQHYISAASYLPGTQSGLCGEEGEQFCVWGAALNVNDRFMYVSQPTYDRVIVISIPQLAVVEVIPTDAYPVNLHYVPHSGQVWVLCWRSDQDDGYKTIQVIRDAGEKKKHETVHLEPVHGGFDLLLNLFMPPFGRDLMRGLKHGYVSHAGQTALSKVDLDELRYSRTVDLSRYACLPADVAFSALYGFVFVRCKDVATGQDSRLLVLDYVSDVVVSQMPALKGRIFVTPDSRRLVVLQDGKHGVNIVVMRITSIGLSFHFDIRSTLNLSDVAFYPSTSAHGYDMFATTVDKDDVLFLDLFTGQVEMITGVGKPIQASKARFSAPVRPIYSPASFDRYLVTPGLNMAFVINGHARAVGCEVGALEDPRLAAWASTMPA